MREPYNREVLAELAGRLRASGWRVEGGEVVRPAWHDEAACRGVGAGAFFPEDRGTAVRAGRELRERYCSGCPVVAECLEAGEAEGYGLWGGLSPRARERRRQAA